MTRTWVTLAVLLALAACDRVVYMDIEEGPTRLVIEARLERLDIGTRPQQIRLSLTDDLTKAGPPPPALGAYVEVSDGARRYAAIPSAGSPGLYVFGAELVPEVGGVYTLTIDYDGEQYRAVDTLLAVAPIDSLYFEYREQSIMGDAGIRSVIDYTDPPSPGHFYLWQLVVNDSVRIRADFGNRMRIVSSDQFYNGSSVVGFRPYDEEIVVPGDRVTMRQVALALDSYTYYGALLDQSTGNDGSPFAIPAASVRGNVANLTKPDHYPLGYFLAAGVSERTALVPSP